MSARPTLHRVPSLTNGVSGACSLAPADTGISLTMRAKEGRGSGRARGRFDAATGATSSGINILQSSRETPSEKGHRIFRKLKAGLVSTPQLRPLLCKALQSVSGESPEQLADRGGFAVGSQVNGHYCRFLDGNRFNSRPENLCWITGEEAFAHPECAPPTAFRTPPQTSAMMSASGLTFFGWVWQVHGGLGQLHLRVGAPLRAAEHGQLRLPLPKRRELGLSGKARASADAEGLSLLLACVDLR